MQNKTFVNLAVVFGIIVSLFFFAKFVNEVKATRFIGSGTTATNKLTVSGEGESYAVPDIATISFTVQEEKKTVTEAEKLVTDKANKAIDFLKKSGVEEKDIQLISNSFYPVYDYGAPCYGYPCPTVKPTITGYNVSRTVTVKVRAIDDSGKIVEGLGSLGVSNLNGPNFTVDNEDGVKDEARKQAIDDAKAKAEKLARDLGVRIVRVIDFSESGNQPYPMPMYAKDMAMGMGGATESVANMPKGENQYTSNVTITYEIR